MSITEHQRNKLHNRAHEVFGVEEGDLLMESLPPVGWGEVATRRDLDQSADAIRADFRAEFAEFRAEMRSEFAEFRADMRGEFAEFRADIRGEFADFRSEIHKVMARMIWTMTVAMIATVVASAGFAFTAGLAV